ncbi:hypothetical protein OD350_03665 [Clostridium beijerinckii]|uniref:hypothetical protein n=1 Tax=Clostridium beijerinckii TaxID=1520 RepID=UPI002226FF11|nr:hypothetical protein [Clostridium beijerinckii]UYZ36780.1 hypothetical protein OD350_03665 [Clostridium beijerinckii]
MGNWKKSKLYIKVLNNSSDETSRISQVKEKPFNENKKIKADDSYYAEYGYGLEIDEDVSRDEAEFIEGFYSDYEDFDTVDYTEINLSDYEMSEEQAIECFEDYFEDEEYDESCIYLNGEKAIYDGIRLKDVMEEITIKNFSNKDIIVLKGNKW